jgi:hypothetical protein
MHIHFWLPSDFVKRLRKHPDFPSWGGREKFYIQVFINFINSPEFKLRVLEEENRRIRNDRDQKAKNAEFWKSRAGGFQNLFPPKPNPAPPAQPDQDKTNAA